MGPLRYNHYFDMKNAKCCVHFIWAQEHVGATRYLCSLASTTNTMGGQAHLLVVTPFPFPFSQTHTLTVHSQSSLITLQCLPRFSSFVVFLRSWNVPPTHLPCHLLFDSGGKGAWAYTLHSSINNEGLRGVGGKVRGCVVLR